MTPVALWLAMIPTVGLSADLKGTLTLADTERLIARPALIRPGNAVDLETAPSAGVGFGWRHSELSFGYVPRITWSDFESSDPELLVVQSGTATYTYSGHHYRFSLSQGVSEGRQTYSSYIFGSSATTTTTTGTTTPGTTTPGTTTPGTTPPPIGQAPAPTQTTVRVGSEQTTASLEVDLSRRWSSAYSASYTVGGGLGADRVLIPLLKTATTSAALTYTPSRIDQLVTTVSLTNTVASNDNRYWYASELETWNHRLTRELSLSIGAGFVEVRSHLADGTTTYSIYPSGTANLAGALYLVRKRHLLVTLGFGTSFSPYVNTITGKLDNRLAATSTLEATMDRTTFALTGDAAQNIPFDSATATTRLFGLGASVTYTPGKLVDLSAGYRSFWQFTSPSDSNSTVPRQWIAFVAVAIHPPSIRF